MRQISLRSSQKSWLEKALVGIAPTNIDWRWTALVSRWHQSSFSLSVMARKHEKMGVLRKNLTYHSCALTARY